MNNLDLLILTVYIISVTYVIYRAIKSIDNQISIKLDKEDLNAQLDAQGIKALIDMRFKLPERYQTDKLRDLSIAIENKSETATISIDWDKSSLTDFDGRSQRVIRLIPGMTLDLFQTQVASVIAPKRTLEDLLTAEDVLKRNFEGVLVIASTLFPPDELKKASLKSDQFYLRLILQMFDPSASIDSKNLYAVSCKFKVEKLPWRDALEWKPK